LERVKCVLDAARDRGVVVVGDAICDRYLFGDSERMSPEAPVPVVWVRKTRTALGGAANVAAGIASLGGECRLVAVVGRDRAADRLRTLLERAGIGTQNLIEDPTRPTTMKTRVLSRAQQVVRLDRESVAPLAAEPSGRLEARAHAALDGAELLVFEDYDKGTISTALALSLLAAARARGIPSLVDPKLRHFFAFAGATVFKPNGREVAAALGREAVPRDPAELRALASRLRCDHLLVTLGAGGMHLFSHDGPEDGLRFPAQARDVFDVTGAGDTVTAVLAVAMLGGASLAEGAALGNLAAGVAVSRPGTRPVTREELLAECDTIHPTDMESIPGPGVPGA